MGIIKSKSSYFRAIASLAALSTSVVFVAVAELQRPDAAVVTMHAEARVVQVDVVVTDAPGKSVAGLSKRDFAIVDNGKARAIDIFSVNHGEAIRGTAPPETPALPPHVFSNRNAGPPNVSGHSTVIVLDQLNTSHDANRTPFQTAADEQLQVTSLMSKVPPDEQIALYVMAKHLGLLVLQNYTTNRELLLTVLRNYIPRGMGRPPDALPTSARAMALPGSPRRDPNAGSGRESEAAVEDSSRGTMMTLQALAEHLALVPGRKSVFLVRGAAGPLLMHGPWGPAWDKTFRALNEANVAVNTVGEIAVRTRGQSWGMRNDLDAAMAEEMEASRTTYTLGFYLPEGERDNEFHTLEVRTDRAGLQLFYRQGYYAGNTELPASYEKVSKGDMESALLNRVDSTGVGITARVEIAPGTPRGTIQIRLNLDPATLTLKEHGSEWTGKVEEMFVEQSESGNTLARVSDVKEFEVTGGSRAGYASGGVSWLFSVPLAPGAIKMTILVRDDKTGRVGSLTVPLQ